jgi:hypothetical protein
MDIYKDETNVIVNDGFTTRSIKLPKKSVPKVGYVFKVDGLSSIVESVQQKDNGDIELKVSAFVYVRG